MSAGPGPEPRPRPRPPADAELVDAYRRGSERAARELVERHAGAIARFLYSAGALEGDVDDLVQETFFRAFRRVESWRQEATYRSWVFSIARNVLRDELRKAKSRSRGGGARVLPLAEQVGEAGDDPAGEAEARDAEDRLRDGLTQLPRLQREVFVLRAQEGASYDEIAVALGTTPGAARVHYHHAVKRLKEMLA